MSNLLDRLKDEQKRWEGVDEILSSEDGKIIEFTLGRSDGIRKIIAYIKELQAQLEEQKRFTEHHRESVTARLREIRELEAQLAAEKEKSEGYKNSLNMNLAMYEEWHDFVLARVSEDSHVLALILEKELSEIGSRVLEKYKIQESE